MKSFIYLRSDFIRMENHSYPADTGSHFPYGALPYNPALSLWLSVDPLSDKYPGESPYAYCGDNPILLKDPDGREKLIFFNTSSKQNFNSWKSSYNLTYAAHLLPENPEVIYLWAHGVTQNKYKGINIADENGPRSFLDTGGQLAEFLGTESNVFQANQKSGQCSILVLYSCQTGQEGHIAQQTSANANLLVIAPTTNIQVDALYGEDISLAADGKWAVYYKGEFMDYMPNPNINDSKKTIEYYDNIYKTRHQDIDVQQ